MTVSQYHTKESERHNIQEERNGLQDEEGSEARAQEERLAEGCCRSGPAFVRPIPAIPRNCIQAMHLCDMLAKKVQVTERMPAESKTEMRTDG
jgi:hypothetical protein